MQTWEKLLINTTTRELIEKFNINATSSEFIDKTLGSVMSNGLLFTGTETINEEIITPFTPVPISGIVNSDTIFDNFRMYFRETNNVVETNQLPVDLTNFNDAKPHFLYFKEDFTYRVSDYMFGQSDEVLICRFVINEDSTWNQIYIMAQRAGTPAYDAGDEFYSIDGINVKSPGGLKLSHLDGIVRRSGIEFTDKFSPDLYRCFANSSTAVPIRYTNLQNEVDYTADPVQNVDPNHYMTYDSNSKLKNNASERIRNLYNLIYGVDEYAEVLAKALSDDITSAAGQSEYRKIVDIFVAHMNSIYVMVGELADYLSDSYFSTIDLTDLNNNITAYMTFSNDNFGDAVTITFDTVDAIRNAVYYLLPGKSEICDIPMEDVLGVLYTAINELSITSGTLKNVTTDYYTLQRVLWDIYEDKLIVQYGDREFEDLESASDAISSMTYPVPFGRLMYIPLAVIVLKQGETDLATSTESIIITKQYIYADSEQEGFADYVARALANKGLAYIQQILDGSLPVGKAKTLAYNNNGVDTYVSGDFYLDYDNLRNAVKVINNLTSSTYNSKEALSAYQGYLLNQNKLNRDGSNSITGNILPDTTNTKDLGSTDKRFRNIYTTQLNTSGNITSGGNILPSANESKDLGSSSAKWNNLYVKTITGVNSISTTSITTSGNASIGGNLGVTGSTTLKGTTVQGGLTVTGNASVGGTLTLSAKPTFNDASKGGFVLSRGESGGGITVEYLEAASGKNSGNLGNFSNKSVVVSW